jgi:hypothetical protein
MTGPAACAGKSSRVPVRWGHRAQGSGTTLTTASKTLIFRLSQAFAPTKRGFNATLSADTLPSAGLFGAVCRLWVHIITVGLASRLGSRLVATQTGPLGPCPVLLRATLYCDL